MRNTYAMEAEDILANSILRNIKYGTYIDLGCNHPTINNNTYLFYQSGWKGLAIDGNINFRKLWKTIRPNDIFENAVISGHGNKSDFYVFDKNECSTNDFEQMTLYSKKFKLIEKKIIKTEYLCNIKNKYNIDHVDLLNIDVEGSEFEIIKSIDYNKFRPSLILVEEKNYNLNNPTNLNIFLKQNDYKIISKTLLNSFYIDRRNTIFNYLPKNMI